MKNYYFNAANEPETVYNFVAEILFYGTVEKVLTWNTWNNNCYSVQKHDSYNLIRTLR